MKIKEKIIKRRLLFTIITFLFILLIYPFSGTAKIFDNPVKCRVELDRNVLPSESPQNVIIKVTLDAEKPDERIHPEKRSKVNLALVLDRSGSMSGQKLENAKEAAIEALRRLGPNDKCSVVIYDNNVQTIVPAQSAANIEWIEGRIRSIQTGGNTALFGGVSQGASEIRKNLDGGYIHRVILLSDGIANVGPSSPEELGRLGAALLKEEISVTTIGLGTDYNDDLMRQLSQGSDGNTYFVESSRDLPRIFTSELGDVLDVVAKKLKIVVECPEGIRPIKTIGREGRVRGQQIEFSFNHLYGGQERVGFVEVSVPAGMHGQNIDIASAEVTYINSYTQKKGTSKGNATATFSNDIKVVEQSVNVPVQRKLTQFWNATAEVTAIKLSDEGKNADAALVLKESAQNMRDFARKYNDAEMLGEAIKMETEANVIKLRGMSNEQRKYWNATSYQTSNSFNNPAVAVSIDGVSLTRQGANAIETEDKIKELEKKLKLLQDLGYAEDLEEIIKLKKDIAELKSHIGNTAEKVYSKAEIDSPPKVIHAYRARHPSSAQGIQGKVMVAFIVTKEGKVRDASVVSAEPEKIFDQAAIECAFKYTFTPATKGGEPVDSRVILPIIFSR